MLRLGILLCSITLLSGCALTRSETAIPYAPRIGGDALAAAPRSSITLGAVSDNRGLQDPTTIFQKKNLYGDTMSGTFAADRPIATILKEGLQHGLESKGFMAGKDGRALELRTSIEDYSYEVITGFWKGTLKPKMTARFELIDRQTGKSIWRDTLVGRASIDSGDYVIQSVTATIDDLVTKLVNSPSFREAVE